MPNNSLVIRPLNIAVVVVNYHSADLLQRNLAALANQLLKPVQVIVVNNDEVTGAVDALIAQYRDYLFLAPGNIGFAAANNLGFEHCKNFDWIALLNPDAFPEPDWLLRMASSIENHPAAGMFSSKLLCATDSSLVDGDGDCYHVAGLAWRINHGRELRVSTAQRPVFSPCAAAAVYRRSALVEIGGFDESYFCYFEDVDLGFRLRLRGYEAVHVPEAMVYHVGGASSESLGSNDFAIYHGHRNLVWTFVKNMPGYLFWVLLPAHLIMNIVVILFYISKGKAGIILRAKRDAVKGLSRAWKQRREIQRARTVRPAAILKYLSWGVIR